jgi:hypothetical protein
MFAKVQLKRVSLKVTGTTDPVATEKWLLQTQLSVGNHPK